MGLRALTKLFTQIALVLGALSVISCFFVSYIFYGMACSIIGTIISIMVISIRKHYSVPTKWNHRSIIALLLCSAPVLYFLALIYLNLA
jgi:hypothetical protein